MSDTPLKPWHDTSKSVAERVKALLDEMTLEEKVGQLGSDWHEFNPFQITEHNEVEKAADNVPIFGTVAIPPSWEEASKNGLGHITRAFGTKPATPAEGMQKILTMQKDLLRKTRLKIPATSHEECLTGFTTLGATSFPTPLALAATFNEETIEEVSSVIGRDMRAVGVHHALSPVLDLVRDYRWGRVEETMGEDPYLSGVSGTAYVKGLEKNGIVATLKHYAGHSQPSAARNHGPVHMGWREMYDFMLPPFEYPIREAHVGSVMNSYTDVDGLPCAASRRLLTDILRDELGFDGVVVSDYWAIGFLENMHRVAESPEHAATLAINAGLDVELPSTHAYGDPLVSAVKNGRVSMDVLDLAVTRVLTQKVKQGLLDPDWTPEGDMSALATGIDLDSADNRKVALKAARESVILLKNESILPLATSTKKIAIVGPCGDDGAAFLGCYSFSNHVLAMTPGSGLGIEVPSIKESISKIFAQSDISFNAGVPVKDFDTSGISAARRIVDDADVAIVVVGDRAGLFGRGTSGEGNDVADLKLPGAQAELLDNCLDSKTPVIVVSVSGRPYALGAFESRAKAMIQAFMPGEEGGTAIAEVIAGITNPSGRLPVEIPSTVSGQPSTYLQPRYGQPGLGISPVDSIPLFRFGHGLSYTTFEYSNFTVAKDQLQTKDVIEASVTVKNTGSRDGVEVVQLYFDDPVAQVARPVIQLLGFARIALKAGESKTIKFRAHTDRIAYHGADYKRIVDAGEIILSIGASVKDLKASKSITLKGATYFVGKNRELRTEVQLS